MINPIDIINKAIAEDPYLRNMLARTQASYRYFSNRTTKDRYFWTTEKIKHKSGSRYVAGIYRYIKSMGKLGGYKIVKRVGFARRQRAKQWALNAYNKSVEAKATPPKEA